MAALAGTLLLAGCCNGPPTINVWKASPTTVCPGETVRLEWEVGWADFGQIRSSPELSPSPLVVENTGSWEFVPSADRTVVQYVAGCRRADARTESEPIEIRVVRETTQIGLEFPWGGCIGPDANDWLPAELDAGQFSTRLRVRSVRNVSGRAITVTHGDATAPIADGDASDAFVGSIIHGPWSASTILLPTVIGSSLVQEGCPPEGELVEPAPLVRFVNPPTLAIIITAGCD